jgi:hypothetical protein
MLQVGSLSNVDPIFFPHVFIDLDRYIADVETISPITPRPGNPIFLTSVGVDVIYFETACTDEFLATIRNRPPRFRICDSSNTRWTVEAGCL